MYNKKGKCLKDNLFIDNTGKCCDYLDSYQDNLIAIKTKLIEKWTKENSVQFRNEIISNRDD